MPTRNVQGKNGDDVADLDYDIQKAGEELERMATTRLSSRPPSRASTCVVSSACSAKRFLALSKSSVERLKRRAFVAPSGFSTERF